MGPAYSRNLGIRSSETEIIGFIDNDCLPENDWAEKLYSYLRDTNSKVAGVGGRVLPIRTDLISLYYTYHKILDPMVHYGKILYLVTANAAFKKRAVIKAGMFDESLKFPGGEDPGLGIKLRRLGYQFSYYPEAIVKHDFRSNIVDFAATFYRYGMGCRNQVDKFSKE